MTTVADKHAVSAAYLALRAEVYPAPLGGEWVWRVCEPRPGRTATIRRIGRARWRWLAWWRAMRFAYTLYHSGLARLTPWAWLSWWAGRVGCRVLRRHNSTCRGRSDHSRASR